MQTEAPCGLARRQLVEDHQRIGPMCERRPNSACLAVIQRRKQGPSRIASQYTDLPTPDGRRNLRLTRTAKSGEYFRSNRRRDERSTEQLTQPSKSVDMREPDERTRVYKGYLFARHASRFLRSSRRVLALPRMTGMPSYEACSMKSARGMPAILAPRPSDTLSLR